MTTNLVVYEDLHDVLVDLGHVLLGFVWKQDKLDTEQWDEDERGPHGPHVQTWLRLMRHPQLSDEDTDDVEQEEKIHLQGQKETNSIKLQYTH